MGIKFDKNSLAIEQNNYTTRKQEHLNTESNLPEISQVIARASEKLVLAETIVEICKRIYISIARNRSIEKQTVYS